MKKLFFALIAFLLLSCNNNNKSNSNASSAPVADEDLYKEVQTGGIKMVQIETAKGKFKVWTKRIGNNPKIKLLLLHGGPGATHEYFESFESFIPREGIEMIYYDQLGSGNSDNPNDTSMW
ncbi:MAG TPA: hypothetical protein VKH37_08925, partial [Ferruginibacter sp.]|nr:hypothetical protein [Ferruginibacter sp.]